jgi:hypothetical protein
MSDDEFNRDAAVSPFFQGVKTDRYETHPAELAAAQLWEAENLRVAMDNAPPGTKFEPARSLLGCLLSRTNVGINPSDRDWLVACTVAQWLGSPAGRMFFARLAEALLAKD